MGTRNLAESIVVKSAGAPASFSANTYYNGASDASGIGIDTKGYDEAMVVVHAGTATGTLDVSLTATALNSTTASSSTALTSAAFTQITSANDNTVYVANVKTKNIPRYLFVKEVVASDVVSFGAEVLLSKAEKEPVDQDNTIAFNYNY